jgi:prophage antirepressor-like protein
MTTEILREKTGRYLCGQSVPAEKKQIQNWLSCIGNKTKISEEERKMIEDEIAEKVKAYAVSSIFQPKEERWWKKITASF